MSEGIQARFLLRHAGFTLDVDLTLPGHGITALFGHSGSGKTTLLRLIAGLEQASGGRLSVNGEIWQDGNIFLPTHRRSLGYVFQEAGLFPHLNVESNLAYGMKRTALAEQRIDPAFLIELLGIAHLLKRMPDKLSGGEKQRVAIARALFTSPHLLLLDEPLAALDLKRKAEILPYLESLHRELSIPVFYVSHSPEEVARLADSVVLLEEGRVTATGPVAEIMARLDLPIAHGGEAGVMVESIIGAQDGDYALTRLDFAGGRLWVPRHAGPVGSPVRTRILARDVSLALSEPHETSILNILPAEVVETAPEGDGRTQVRLNLKGIPLLAQVSCKSAALLELTPGRQVFAQVKAVSIL
jgi:molybdate transport system ATP-binding protein